MTNRQIQAFIVALFEELAKRDGVPVERIVVSFVEGFKSGGGDS